MLKKMTIGVAPLLAVAAFMVAPAVASAVTLEAGGKEIALGSGISGTSSNLVFTTGLGNLECSSNEVSGTLIKNNEGNGEAEIEVTNESSTGAEPEPAKSCHTTIPNPLTGGVGTLRAVITPTGLPWLIQFYNNGTTWIQGSPKVDFSATLYGLDPEFGIYVPIALCGYAATDLDDTFVFNKSPLIDALSEQTMTLEEGSSGACGTPEVTTGKLNGSFTVESEGEAVEAK